MLTEHPESRAEATEDDSMDVTELASGTRLSLLEIFVSSETIDYPESFAISIKLNRRRKPLAVSSFID